MSVYKVTDTELTNVANAIRQKGGTQALLEWPNGFVSAVGDIEGGSAPILQSKTVSPSVSSQNITPDTGYDGLSSVTVNAISPTKVAQTYTPGTTNQTIAAGRWLIGTQTIKGDANLVANNIKSGVSIFGVTGNYVGEGGLEFYDFAGYAFYGGTMYFAVVEDKNGTHCDVKAGKYESRDWGAWASTSGLVGYVPNEGVSFIGVFTDGTPGD